MKSQQILPALQVPMEVHAVNFWSEMWVPTFAVNGVACNLEDDYGSYAASQWSRAQPGSCLHLALLAVTHAVFGRGRWSSLALERGDKYYGKALTSLSKAMRDPDLVSSEDIDHLLITTMLMASFEVFSTYVGNHLFPLMVC